MSTTPRVSVIIPTYNRVALLMEAIESVLAQSYTDYELIVADDGSTDDTASRVADFGGAVQYVRLSHNGRPSVVRNRAIALARGELIAFLDDDDCWRPLKLERQLALFADDRAPDFVFSDVCLLSDDNISAPVLAAWQKKGGYIFSDLLRDCFIHPSTVVARRDLLRAVGGFDETFASAEDYDLWLRLAYAAPSGFVDEALTWVRRHPGGISRHRKEETARNVIRTLVHARQNLSLSLNQRLRLRRVLARRYTHLGLLLYANGDRRAAREQFLRALNLNPLQARAWRALAPGLRSAL